MGGTMSDRLSYAEKEELPTSVYGLPERREYPMPDAAHVRAAEAYFRYCPEELKPELARAILKRAKEFDVNAEFLCSLQDGTGQFRLQFFSTPQNNRQYFAQ